MHTFYPAENLNENKWQKYANFFIRAGKCRKYIVLSLDYTSAKNYNFTLIMCTKN